VWEPLLEDWRFCLEGHVHAAVSPTVFDVHLQTSAPCSLNFSYSICELLSDTVVTLYEDVVGVSALVPGSGFTPYFVVNQTGVPLSYGRAGAGPPEALLVPGEEQPFDFWPEQERLALCHASGPPPRALTIACRGWTQLEEVSIDRTGRRAFAVEPVCDGQRQLAAGSGALTGPAAPHRRATLKRIICEVSLRGDSKLVRLLSTTTLRNETNHLLEVRVWRPQNDMESVHPLESRAALPMPLRAESGSYRICLRPMDGDYDWSASCTLPGGDAKKAAKPTTMMLECRPLSHGVPSWHFLVHMPSPDDEQSQHGVCEVEIHPPMIFTNLLSCSLDYELRGSGTAIAGRLASGALQSAHAFAHRSPVAFSTQVRPASHPPPLRHAPAPSLSGHLPRRWRATSRAIACW
jgi:hypothetical protein